MFLTSSTSQTIFSNTNSVSTFNFDLNSQNRGKSQGDPPRHILIHGKRYLSPVLFGKQDKWLMLKDYFFLLSKIVIAPIYREAIAPAIVASVPAFLDLFFRISLTIFATAIPEMLPANTDKGISGASNSR